jgi:hypothetical protein
MAGRGEDQHDFKKLKNSHFISWLITRDLWCYPLWLLANRKYSHDKLFTEDTHQLNKENAGGNMPFVKRNQ